MTRFLLPEALVARWRRFRDARDGIAAVEFAMILPLMLTMWLGTMEVGQAIAINRKGVLVSRVLADITARATTITDVEMTNIMNATNAVIYPFSPTTLSLRVTSVKLISAGNSRVVWSDARGSDYTAHPANLPLPMPAGILTVTNQTVIMAEVRYRYAPSSTWFLSAAGLTINEVTYMVPRQVTEITRTAT